MSQHLSGAMEDCSIVRGWQLRMLCRQRCCVSTSRRMFGSLCPCNVRLHLIMHRTIRLMPSFQHSVAVLPFRCYTNSVSAIWITLLTLKNLLCRCRCHLPLCRNCHSVASRIESYFCHSAVGGQPISVVVSSSLWIRKDVSSISVLTRNCNGSYETEERQRYNGTARHNEMEKWQRRNGNGRMATEWWKPGITGYIRPLTLTLTLNVALVR